MSSRRARLLLADDHALLAEGIRKILEPEFDIVGTAENGRLLLELAKELRPDVILVDVSMPLLNGIDAARHLRTLVPDSRIIFLTMHEDRVLEAFEAGGAGYVLKHAASSELVFAIHEVLHGRFYVTPAVARDVVASAFDGAGARRAKPALTPRQREVLQLVAEGKTVKEIASILGIAVKTVEYHKTRLMETLDLHTTAELTKYAVSHGIASL
jgi:DNA-binding NarL/FixJ family response regulator